jgi:hypothetical protein
MLILGAESKREKSGAGGGGGGGPPDDPPPPHEISEKKNTPAKANQDKLRVSWEPLGPSLLRFIVLCDQHRVTLVTARITVTRWGLTESHRTVPESMLSVTFLCDLTCGNPPLNHCRLFRSEREFDLQPERWSILMANIRGRARTRQQGLPRESRIRSGVLIATTPVAPSLPMACTRSAQK